MLTVVGGPFEGEDLSPDSAPFFRLLSQMASEMSRLPRRDLFLEHLVACGRDLGLNAALLADLHGSVVVCKESAGFTLEEIGPFRIMPVAATLPLTDAVRTSLPVIIENPERLKELYPALASSFDEVEPALAALPVMRHNTVAGVLGLRFDTELQVSPMLRDALEGLAGLAAILGRDQAFTAVGSVSSSPGDTEDLAGRVAALEAEIRKIKATISFTARTTVQFLDS